MNKLAYILSLLLAGVLVGCAPFSDNAVKRVDALENSSAVREGDIDVQQIKSVNVPALDRPTRQIIQSYGSTIRKYSKKYGFDWRLTLAIMKAESNFADTAESHRGARGLMQIMPATQEELAERLNIENIAEPQGNIRAGIFYLSKLQRMFRDADENNRLRLTLAAYNAGPGRVFDAQDVAEYLKSNPSEWSSVKDALPLLSKRYYTLHNNVWESKRPPSGTFGNHRETIAYVEKVMNNYDEYRLILN